MTNQATWHTKEDDSTWERVKAALKNDWEQTKNDFGSDKARDLDQDVDDTVKQIFDVDDKFENREQALRFGVAARRQFGAEHQTWSDDLDRSLRAQYPGDNDADRGRSGNLANLLASNEANYDSNNYNRSGIIRRRR